MDRNRKAETGLGLTLALAALGLALVSWAPWPAEPNPVKLMRDDALARKYCPVFAQGEGIKPDLSRVYYRLGEDEKRYLLACHPVWPYEKDEGKKGLETVFNKLFYTGGLKLQTRIFGPEDIEAIELAVDKDSGKIIRVRCESAGHDKQEVAGEAAEKIARPWFEVTTWNHMFELTSPEAAAGKKVYDLAPEYFTDERWSYYGMTKKKQTLLRQDRAHFEWEHQ